MSKKHVASCSFGKDSVASLLLAREHGGAIGRGCVLRSHVRQNCFRRSA